MEPKQNKLIVIGNNIIILPVSEIELSILVDLLVYTSVWRTLVVISISTIDFVKLKTRLVTLFPSIAVAQFSQILFWDRFIKTVDFKCKFAFYIWYIYMISGDQRCRYRWRTEEVW